MISRISLLLFLAAPLAAQSPAPAPAAAPVAAPPAAPAEENIAWHDVTTWGVEGRAWPEQERLRWFDRLLPRPLRDRVLLSLRLP